VLRVEGVVKRYPAAQRRAEPVLAADGVCLEVASGQFFTIVGPSGCGKTTTLRCIAGLEQPDEGRIVLEDRVLFSHRDGVSVPTNVRGLGMVFQSYAVWPHMDVFANVAFPLTVAPRRLRPPRAEVRARVERALAAVRLDDLAGRPATDLSSGQQQRVALARALVTEPPLLLLDEPLSNIDAKLREEMRAELLRLQRELGVTTVYVTHDQVEALALSDVVAVMDGGRVEQVGPPREVYDRPSSTFVADFIGSSNLLRGTVVSRDDGRVEVRTAGGTLGAAGTGLDGAREVVVVLRPERIAMAIDDDSTAGCPGHTAWHGEVRTTSFLGDALEHLVAVGDLELRVRTDPTTEVRPGTRVVVRFADEDCTAHAAR
jgi:iron(III) transport system ATP-binding protein